MIAAEIFIGGLFASVTVAQLGTLLRAATYRAVTVGSGPGSGPYLTPTIAAATWMRLANSRFDGILPYP